MISIMLVFNAFRIPVTVFGVMLSIVPVYAITPDIIPYIISRLYQLSRVSDQLGVQHWVMYKRSLCKGLSCMVQVNWRTFSREFVGEKLCKPSYWMVQGNLRTFFYLCKWTFSMVLANGELFSRVFLLGKSSQTTRSYYHTVSNIYSIYCIK